MLSQRHHSSKRDSEFRLQRFECGVRERRCLEPLLADLPLPKTPEAAILARQLTRNRGNVR